MIGALTQAHMRPFPALRFLCLHIFGEHGRQSAVSGGAEGIAVISHQYAKGGVAQLTKALANEWASKGVNVNAIAPGYMATENTLALQNDPVRNRQIVERIPSGRWGEPCDIAGAAVFLCSAASNYVHGHVLAVDGGWLAR